VASVNCRKNFSTNLIESKRKVEKETEKRSILEDPAAKDFRAPRKGCDCENVLDSSTVTGAKSHCLIP